MFSNLKRQMLILRLSRSTRRGLGTLSDQDGSAKQSGFCEMSGSTLRDSSMREDGFRVAKLEDDSTVWRRAGRD